MQGLECKAITFFPGQYEIIFGNPNVNEIMTKL